MHYGGEGAGIFLLVACCVLNKVGLVRVLDLSIHWKGINLTTSLGKKRKATLIIALVKFSGQAGC